MYTTSGAERFTDVRLEILSVAAAASVCGGMRAAHHHHHCIINW
jgi:hypothetical protein